MATTRDVIRYNIGIISDSIHKIKQASRPHINPRHPSWARYRQLKREASIWLTMLSLVKVANGDRADVAIHADGRLGRRVMFQKASKRLGRLAHRLDKNPAKWAYVDAWVAKRTEELAISGGVA